MGNTCPYFPNDANYYYVETISSFSLLSHLHHELATRLFPYAILPVHLFLIQRSKIQISLSEIPKYPSLLLHIPSLSHASFTTTTLASILGRHCFFFFFHFLSLFLDLFSFTLLEILISWPSLLLKFPPFLGFLFQTVLVP